MIVYYWWRLEKSIELATKMGQAGTWYLCRMRAPKVMGRRLVARSASMWEASCLTSSKGALLSFQQAG
ncbi:hypothetical protein HQ563_04225 [bacterium]|nr:hypothetical protein [bacterium]